MFAEDTIIYVENSKISTKTSELVSDYSKFVGYKVNIDKSLAFLYVNEQLAKAVLRYKSNKTHTRSIWGKLQYSEERNKRSK